MRVAIGLVAPPIGNLSYIQINTTYKNLLFPLRDCLAERQMTSNNTVHISLGTTANYVTSHLLNLQGLAATTSQSGGSGGDTNDDDVSSSLCDASVTHDISPVDSDYNSTRSSSSSSQYMYVPRTLIIDGRDSFGTAWGGVSCNSKYYNNQHQHQTASSSTTSTANGNDAWNGTVSVFDPSDHANIFGDQHHPQNQQNDTRIPPQIQQQHEDDPLHKFQSAASIMGLSPIHSRFNATLPSHSSYNVSSSAASSSRHVQWDEEDEEEEEDDDYYYGQNDERIQEEKRRQLEKMEQKQSEDRKNWNTCMEDAWEETFYGASSVAHDMHRPSSSSIGSNEVNNTTSDRTEPTSDKATYNTVTGRDIQWYDYWMPPKPSPSKYQVPLPFDTAITNSNSDPNSSLWSTSFNMGYNPTSSGGGMTTGGNSSNGITHSWREHVLSESLRKVLEGCDVVKGFNIFVDGGGGNNHGFSNNTDPSSNGGTNKHTKQLSNIMAGGGFHAGLATSLLEELSEECRSAGRWVVMVDPISSSNNEKENNTEGRHVHQFRQRLNAGLALHGLSTNADAFLPVSIDGAYTALRGTNSIPTSSNRMLFEGSAAIALALEASMLFYRLHHRQPPSSSSHSSGRRSRIGIQSGFYQGSSGNGYEDCDNEPYASAPALTYHEFLACARPSSDRRRSILELDALLRPISFPSTSGDVGGDTSGSSGVDVASLLLASGGQVSPSILASLTSSGLISGGTATMGELQKRIMRGTSVERMRMEQERQQYRSSRNRQSEPGDWMEDISTLGGGGLLSSLSGNSTPFGRRASHHHFALSTSLRPASSEKVGDTSAFLRPMMESMGVRYRPEVSLGSVVKDSVSDLTGVGSYWRSIFTNRRSSAVSIGGEGNVSTQTTQQPSQKLSPRDIATHTSVLSVLGNSTRSYPRINSISTGFIDSLHSRRNRGYLSRDVMSGIMPEQDDCEEALEYCQELVDVYEPPLGSGLVDGEDENDIDAYHDEDE